MQEGRNIEWKKGMNFQGRIYAVEKVWKVASLPFYNWMEYICFKISLQNISVLKMYVSVFLWEISFIFLHSLESLAIKLTQYKVFFASYFLHNGIHS